MLTLLVAVPLGFVIIGPVANMIADWIAAGIMGVYNFSPVIAGILLGGLWQILVVFGVHMGLSAVAMVQLGSGQPTPIYALTCCSPSFSQTATVIAIWLKTKDEKLKNIALPAWVSGIFGVTEPAIYGVTLPRIKFFIISCIGAALGGAYAGFSGMLYYQLAGLGIFSITAFMGGEMSVGSVIFNYSVVVLISMAFSFIVTYVLYKDEDETKDTDEGIEDKKTEGNSFAEKKETALYAPMKGKISHISEAKDEAFSQGLLGNGIVIEPEDGKVYAPADASVSVLFPTLHAIGLETDTGTEILIHIGLNTVELNGEGFKAHVKQGDRVKKGDLLIEADLVFIKGKNLCTQTPMIITNTDAMGEFVFSETDEVQPGDLVLTVYPA